MLMIPPPQKMLVVTAHPDDADFMCGGTLALAAKCGAKITLVCLSKGENGNYFGEECYNPDWLGELRRIELIESAEMLGISQIFQFNFPDGSLADLPIGVISLPLAALIRVVRPDCVITFGCDGLTGHADHIAAGIATTLAFEQAARPGSTLFYAGLSTELVSALSTRLEGDTKGIPLGLRGLPESEFELKVNISSTSNIKFRALQCHSTQFSNFREFRESDWQLLSQAEFFKLAQIASH